MSTRGQLSIILNKGCIEEFLDTERSKIVEQSDIKNELTIQSDLFNSLVNETKQFVYKPGDVVSGYLEITPMEADIDVGLIKDIKVTLRGKLDIRWLSGASDEKRTRLYPRHKSIALLEQEVIVWTSKYDSTSLLCESTSRFPFEFLLPTEMLGSCSTVYLEEHCRVLYYLDAVVNYLPNPICADRIIPVYIERHLVSGDPAMPAEVWSSPSVEEKTHSVGCYGSINAKVSLRNGVFLEEGKPIVIDFSIDNHSRKTVRKIKCRLKQSFRVYDDGKVRIYPIANTVSKAKAHVNVAAGTNEELTLCLPLPAGQEASIHTNPESSISTHLNIKYFLHVEIYTGHWSINGPSFTFKVVVGSSTNHVSYGLYDCEEQNDSKHLIKDRSVELFKRFPLHGIRQLLVGEHFHSDSRLRGNCLFNGVNFHPKKEMITLSNY